MGSSGREDRKRKRLGIRPPPTRPDPEPNPLQETNLPPPVARPSPVLATSAASEVYGPDTRAMGGPPPSHRPGSLCRDAARHKHRTGPDTGGKASAFQRGVLIPPSKSRTPDLHERGKADCPQPPGGLPPLAIALRAPPRDRTGSGRPHIQGRVPFQGGWGEGAKNPRTSAPKPSPLICRGQPCV